MARLVRDLLYQGSARRFVGREAELAALGALLHEHDHPQVVHVYGVGGIGKSALLAAFAVRAEAAGATVVRLDCRSIEPTERGFLDALANVTDRAQEALEAATRLSALGETILLALDTYEVFRLMDTWLRQVFLPMLGENVRVVLCGREPPVEAWLTSPEWRGLFQAVPLRPLSDDEAVALLRASGIEGDPASRILRFAGGHPLALTLAVAALGPRAGAAEGDAVHAVVDRLARLYLSDIEDPLTREAVRAASVVRRTTLPLLAVLLPQASAEDAYDRLGALPFVEADRDGLVLHDSVRHAVAVALHASDPAAHRDRRRAAWRELRREVSNAAPGDLWRYTADMLYLVEHPVVREAFFPSASQPLAVEPARPIDAAAIGAIARAADGEASAPLEAWWGCHPEAFSVVRDEQGDVVGFYAMLEAAALSAEVARADPVARRWLGHLRDDPTPRGQSSLLLRRWLAREHGERPSAVQAACWLDVKRAYMALRPRLRRVYLALADPAPYAQVAQQLGFRPLPGLTAELGGQTYCTALLDFGPASVDGWISRLVAGELGLAGDDYGLLDPDERALVVGEARVGLSRLEFDVLAHLQARAGRAVSRVELMEQVWGYEHERASNVVDAMVRVLRRKLGPQSARLETVRGVGYRLRE